MGPKALNLFNGTVYIVDCWDLKRIPKHSQCSINIYSIKMKWTVRYRGGVLDVLLTNPFLCWREINEE